MKKLFDIQTGEYLELGTDWLDGGEYIELRQFITEEYLFFPSDAELPPHKIRWTKFEKDIQYEEGQFIVKDKKGYVVDHCNNLHPYGEITKIEISKNPAHTLNIEWNSLFKNCVYGDRYVKIETVCNANVGDITDFCINQSKVDKDDVEPLMQKGILAYSEYGFWYYQYDHNTIHPIMNKSGYQRVECSTKQGNLLEEYSKFTRDEKNKLLEFEKLLGFNK